MRGQIRVHKVSPIDLLRSPSLRLTHLYIMPSMALKVFSYFGEHLQEIVTLGGLLVLSQRPLGGCRGKSAAVPIRENS